MAGEWPGQLRRGFSGEFLSQLKELDTFAKLRLGTDESRIHLYQPGSRVVAQERVVAVDINGLTWSDEDVLDLVLARVLDL